ncbi:MAG: D-2-hydroxyacid dehydrogenase [Chitinophagales bacterium]|nr:D-2-hydroxyacid dehydrogenase [Chitinophagales bacterium]
MNIVVVDGYTLNPGDLDIKDLQKLGAVTVYDRSSYHQLAERLRDAEIAVVNKAVFDQELIHQLPKLKYIAVTATGYNNLDISYLKEKGILVSNVTNYGSHAVAQHAFALLLELCNHVGLHHEECKQGRWNEITDFCFWSKSMTELYGKKMGIIGLGNIGLQTAKIAQAFGMHVYYHSRTDKQIADFKYVETVEKVLSTCDVISLHCTLNADTQELINKHTLSLFKPDAFLMNTSRGGLINEKDLLEALDKGRLAGVGLDVLSEEPPKTIHPLIHHPKCIVTPHNAWAAKETRQRLLDIAIQNIKSYIEGSPENLVW